MDRRAAIQFNGSTDDGGFENYIKSRQCVYLTVVETVHAISTKEKRENVLSLSLSFSQCCLCLRDSLDSFPLFLFTCFPFYPYSSFGKVMLFFFSLCVCVCLDYYETNVNSTMRNKTKQKWLYRERKEEQVMKIVSPTLWRSMIFLEKKEGKKSKQDPRNFRHFGRRLRKQEHNQQR